MICFWAKTALRMVLKVFCVWVHWVVCMGEFVLQVGYGSLLVTAGWVSGTAVFNSRKTFFVFGDLLYTYSST